MADKKHLQLAWPAAGLDRRFSLQRQAPYSTASASNVMTYADGRYRGGSRPGLSRAFTGMGHATTGQPVRMLNSVTYVVDTSGPITQLVAACGPPNGNFFYQDSETSFANHADSVISPNRLISSTEFNQKLYIADHALTESESETSYVPKVWNPNGLVFSEWEATTGDVPVGCTCICTFRGRVLLAGGVVNPYGVFGSRQDDPLDFDYSQVDVGGAFSIALAEAGRIGDLVSAMIPHGDSCVVIGSPTQLWLMAGDPKYGGQVLQLSSTIGIIDRNAWCNTPEGILVFLSNDGLYMLPPGCSAASPQSISRERLPEELRGLDTTLYATSGIVVSMAYDIRFRGIHIFLTPHNYLAPETFDNEAAGAGTHWFFDWTTKAFWQVTFGRAGFEPWTCHARKNFPSSESLVLIGGQDGFVRSYDSDNELDDEDESSEESITSSILFGPFMDSMLDSRLDEFWMSLSQASGTVTWEVYRADTAEEAYDLAVATDGEPDANGSFTAGRSPPQHPRVRGPVIYIKLTSTDSAWQFESAGIAMSRLGKVRV